jgi:hypothetical protein
LTVGIQFESLIDARLAGQPRYWLNCPPKDIAMRLPDQVLRTVCFISRSTADIVYGGTGFVVAVRGDHGNAYLHLVTAKHVAQAVEGAPFVIGINTKGGKKAILDADLESGGLKWWYHPTEPNAVDTAVTMFSPANYDQLEVEWVFEDMFTNPSLMTKAGIGVGDEIAIIGLFTPFSGKDKHFPIARIGNLAMLPTERIPVEGFEPMEAYLAEVRSLKGLSGSPVFVRETLNFIVSSEKGGKAEKHLAGCGQIHFLGLISAHWDLPKIYDPDGKKPVNMGVSIVVPAHKIMEVVNHPELVEMRKQYDAKYHKDMSPTLDTAFDNTKPKPFTKANFEDALKKASRKLAVPRKK